MLFMYKEIFMDISVMIGNTKFNFRVGVIFKYREEVLIV